MDFSKSASHASRAIALSAIIICFFFSLLDCVKPLQFDAGSQTLLRRPPGEKMHFGSLTRGEACWPWPADALAARLCVDAAEYSMQVPVAAALGSTSLLKYEFLEGYACRRVSEVPGEGDGKVLSRAVAPNRVVTCPSVAHGSPVRVDPVTCGIECDSGFVLQEGQCVSVCHGLNATCERGWAAEMACVQGAQTLYNCSQCPPQAGFGAAAFDPNNAFQCQYTACAAGTRSVGRDCEPCGVNTFSNASEAVACEDCDTLVTGVYQRESGGSYVLEFLATPQPFPKLQKPAHTRMSMAEALAEAEFERLNAEALADVERLNIHAHCRDTVLEILQIHVRKVCDEVRPSVGTWEFKDSDTAQEFWDQLRAHEVYQRLNNNYAKRSAKRTLSALGYSPVKSTGLDQFRATKWSCSLQEAVIRPYYWTRRSLDKVVKEEIKNYPIDFAQVSDQVSDEPQFKLITNRNVSAVASSFFPFEKDDVHCVPRKLRELVAISKHLRAFHADAKIKVLI